MRKNIMRLKTGDLRGDVYDDNEQNCNGFAK